VFRKSDEILVFDTFAEAKRYCAVNQLKTRMRELEAHVTTSPDEVKRALNIIRRRNDCYGVTWDEVDEVFATVKPLLEKHYEQC